MKYYKKLSTVNEISKKTLDYLNKNNLIYGNKIFYSGLNKINYFTEVQEIENFFLDLKLQCTGISLIKIFENNVKIHIDNSPNFGSNHRINIPVLNAEFSQTIFYENVTGIKTTKKLPNGATYFEFLEKDCIEVDRVSLDCATILNVSVPHKVVCQRFPRIAISFHITTISHLLL